jgi:hypothetical protein
MPRPNFFAFALAGIVAAMTTMYADDAYVQALTKWRQ